MSATEKTSTVSPSAPQYIPDNFESSDRIGLLELNRDFGGTIDLQAPNFGASASL
jgi:hypothetical protein